MCNKFEIEDKRIKLDISIDEENIIDDLYFITQLYFREKYKMDDDTFKQLQDIMYNGKIAEKIETILSEIDEDIQYIPEIQKD